jgi:hypothetical protein
MMLQNFKITFYMNSHADKLFGKRKRVDLFINMRVILWKDDGRGTMVKGNDDGGWSSDDVVF